MNRLEEDLRTIVELHNEVRSHLYAQPSAKAHMMNENTVLRLSALLEAWNCEAPTDVMRRTASDGEIAVRTLKYLRNLIIHRDHGVFLECTGSKQWPAFEAFARKHPEAMVEIGAPLCLAGDAVLTPLLEGLLQWIAENGLGSSGP